MQKQPPVISLLTDFGRYDSYVGTMKGVILGINPFTQIIDLCEDISPQDIFGAAYALHSAYKYFPEGTVHLCVVDPGVGSDRKIICLKTEKYVFLAPDNGVLSFIITQDKPEIIIEVTNKEYFLPKVSNTFHGRDIFAPVAAHIVNGIELEKLGNKIDKIKKIDLPRPVLSPDGILTAEVIHIDIFGNLITNVDHVIFKRIKELRPDDKLPIVIAGKRILKINNSYADVNDENLLAIFGSSGFLEIAVNKGNAKKTLNAEKGDKVVIGS